MITGDSMAPERGPAQHRRSPWIALVLLVGLGVTMAGIFPFRQIIAQQRQVELAEQKLEALEAENANLEAQIRELETPVELERLAREELGLVRPGEIAVTVNPAPGVDPAPRPGGVEEVPGFPDEDRTLLQRVWDFLTGRDLAPDG